MDYIGSKEKLNDWIFGIILSNIESKNITFMDACSGSGAVSKYAATQGFKKIISNDLFHFSSVIINGAISMPERKLEIAYEKIEELNKLNGINGFFYKNYSENSGRIYFSNDNAMKIDAIRNEIESYSDFDVKEYLLYCSLEALSRVSNTAGVQAAFLKKLKDRALKPLELKAEKTFCKSNVYSFSWDILDLLKNSTFKLKHKEDILYIDPPYNNRQYGSNYHLYETFIRFDNPVLSGKTGIRDWQNESKSKFCSKSSMIDFTKSILESTRAEKIYISYNTDGLISEEILKKEICNMGYSVKIHRKEYKRFKSDSSDDRIYNNSKLEELLFEVIK
jgi:adenine-specific DNA-methyltransferase